MSATVQDQLFREASLLPDLAKPVCHVHQVTGLGSVGWKPPSIAPLASADSQHLIRPVAHRNQSSAFGRIAVGHEDDPIVPVEIFNADSKKLSSVSHSCISRQNDNVPKQFKSARSPAAGFRSSRPLLFEIIIKSQCAAMLLEQFESWNLTEKAPFLCLVKHSP